MSTGAMLDNFIKTNKDQTYKYTSMLRHQGTVIGFAMDDKRRIWYAVLDLGSDTTKSPLDVYHWKDPQVVNFPNEIAEVGFGVADQTRLPVFKKDSDTPEAPDAILAPSDTPDSLQYDYFRSTTARLTADAPFQALSDGKFVYIFRQAIDRTHGDRVFVRDKNGREITDSDDQRVPLVDATLLVDRFVLVGPQLTPKLEVRYQRSRSKTRPASRKDGLGAKDLDGNYFYEPTQEVRFVDRLHQGRFTVLLVPTQVVGIERWQIFACNGRTGLIDAYSVERSSDGLFNTKGTQFYTSPDPEFQKDVFEAKPGKDPFTGEDLIPIISSEGFAESALELDGVDDSIGLNAELTLGSQFTQEAWICPGRPQSTAPQALITGDDRLAASHRNPNAAPGLWIERQTRLRAGFGDGTHWHEVTTKSVLSPEGWTHVAVTFDRTAYRIYINGRLREKAETLTAYQFLFNGGLDLADTLNQGEIPAALRQQFTLLAQGLADGVTLATEDKNERWLLIDGAGNALYEIENTGTELAVFRLVSVAVSNVNPPANSPIRFFSSASEPYSGKIDEIRLWNRYRTGSELQADRHQRLIGKEPGLVGYWRFDEGRGNTVYDQTDSKVNGTHHGGTWITSDAPIGQNSGVNRSSFQVATKEGNQQTLRTVESGLTALLYYQQAKVASGYDGKEKPLKQNARVMLAVATKKSNGTRREIATLDFGVSRAGTLAQVPDVVPLEILQATDDQGQSINQRLDTLSQKQGEIHQLNEEIINLTRSIEPLQPVLTILNDGLKNPPTFRFEIPPGRWSYLNDRLLRLQDAASAITRARGERDSLNTELVGAQTKVYEHSSYRGRSLTYGRGFVGYTELNAANFNDIITSLSIPRALQVTVYEHANRGGKSRLLSTATANVGDAWNDLISSMDIAENSDFKALRDKAETALRDAQSAENDLRSEITQARDSLRTQQAALIAERQAKQNRLSTLQTEEQGLHHVLRHGAEVTMKLVHTDAYGLTLSGSVLGFAWTNDTPLLFDSAMGSLALYFQGESDQFFVAYYTTQTQRAQYRLVDGAGRDRIFCEARSADLEMDKIVITVSGGDALDTCTVTITGPEIEETWQKMPRSAPDFVRILNGEAGDRSFIGHGYVRKAQGQIQGLHLPDSGTRHALQAGMTLMVGDHRVILTQAANKGDTDLAIANANASSSLPTTSLPVFALEYDYAVNAATNKVPSDLYNGSLLVRAAENPGGDPTLALADQRVASGSTLSCSWTAAAPGTTLTFDGNTTYGQALSPDRLDKFDVEDDLTLEAWVKPNAIAPPESTNRSGTDKARLLQHHTAASDYSLGLQFRRAPLVFNGAGEHVDLGNILNPDDSPWTIELWFRCDRTHGENILYNKESLYEAAVRDGYFQYAWQPHWHWDGDDSFPVDPGQWYHAAVVFDGTEQRVYCNGVGVFSRPQTGSIDTNDTKLLVAARGDSNPRHYFQGAIDDLRVWNTARTANDIKANLHKRLNSADANLVGYWLFGTTTNGTVPDSSQNSHQGALVGDPSLVTLYTVFAGVNGKWVRSREVFPTRTWIHWTLAFTQAYGVQFDGFGGHLDGGDADPLNIHQDLTVDVDLEIESGRTQEFGVLAKGVLESGGSQNVPYTLTLDLNRKIVFTFEDEDSNNHSFRSRDPISAGQPQRVTVTRKRETLILSLSATETYTFAWDDIRFYIDGRDAGTDRYASDEDALDVALALDRDYDDLETAPDGRKRELRDLTGDRRTFQPPAIGRTDRPFIIGQGYSSGSATPLPFKGIISQVSIWNTARTNLSAATGQGMVGWWRFTERTGSTAFDSVGENHATFKGTVLWVSNPDPARSKLALYHNGVSIEAETLADEEKTALQTSINQFTLGALRDNNTALSQHYQGEMEEVRVWKTTRTQEQIQDNIFRRLTGEREDLIAYYTFDIQAVGTEPSGSAGTPPQSNLLDSSFRNNTLSVHDANYVLSTAPIGEDTPQVRSALAGVRTPFHGQISRQPGIAEYGDLQYADDGSLIGSFKRCYSVIRNGQWQLITGFKVGDLVTEWIGQVQFAPQLIGYIEGAPPVPSENLAGSGYVLGEFEDYVGASAIELTQADQTTYTYTASKDTGADLAINFKLGGVLGAKADVGFIYETEALDIQNVIGGQGSFETAWSWLEDASTGMGRTTSQSTRMELKGSVENVDAITYPAVGRRFVPDNVGMALVISETADVFALRLKHNGALISFQMRPNPDIPPDRNIITFPINPRNTKQGALDGKIGFEPDPNYPNALTYSSDISYFKPIEAYALKNKIDQEAASLATYYGQYDAQGTGRATPQAGSALADSLRNPGPNIHKRNMVNTYVWTSDGGLFAEQQETLDVSQEVLGGSYAFKGMGGLYTDLTFGIFSIGFRFELDALAGGHLNRTVTKSQESETGFALNVDLGGVEGDVYLRDSEGNLVMDLSDARNPRPKRQPGRVDAYRFMSFYLEPKSDHFDTFFNKVVDPIWLEQSDSANAAALREVKQDDKRPPCWRIMHRVTYVSRVLPPLSDAAPASLESTLQSLNIDSNYELIKQLEPFVSDSLTSYPEFTQSLKTAVETYLPELIPHLEAVNHYMSLYFGLTDPSVRAAGTAEFGQATLADRVLNQPPLVNAGPDQVIGLEHAVVTTELDASVIDDRLERTSSIFISWAVLDRPETDLDETQAVRFSDPFHPGPNATFTRRGRYTLRVTASDGELSAGDDVVITVNEAPVIIAGPEQSVGPTQLESLLESETADGASYRWLKDQQDLASATRLAGRIRDDGLGDPDHGTVSVKWTKVSGAGAVAFHQDDSLDTLATFDKSGNYLLQLSVDNGSFTRNAQVMVAVAARVTDGLQVLYTFEEGTGPTVSDVSGVATPLDLTIPDDSSAVSWRKGGLAIQAPTMLTVSGSVSRLTDTIKSTQEITLEAWIKPAGGSEQGLARLVTLSSGRAARNFTLGQSGNRYQVDLRTTTTNDNASNKALAGGLVDPVSESPQHLVCTRDRAGMARMYVDGTEVASRLVSGDFSNWDSSFALALGDEHGSDDGHDRAWSGEYHLVAIYNRALRKDEVTQNFEFGADTNLPPVVSAGEDRVLDWDDRKDDTQIALSLAGRVTHDRPSVEATVAWAQVGGPGSPDGVKFSPENTADAEVVFGQRGRYVLRLTANDGEFVAIDETVVVVNVSPKITVAVGSTHLALTGPGVSTDLGAEIEDTGLGDGSQATALTFTWSGPDSVRLSNASQRVATATFTAPGVYDLKLTVSNGRLSRDYGLGITVDKEPKVEAGSDQTITLPDEKVMLAGRVTQTGLGDPADTLRYTWETVSSPDGATTVDRAPGDQLQTEATFSTTGVYRLRLTATNPNNDSLTASAEVTITINRVPVVDAGSVPGQPLLVPAHSPGYCAVWLDGTVSDDGLPNPPGEVRLSWSVAGGEPGGVSFEPDDVDCTEARFTKKGKYTLQLEADDGAATASEQVDVIVNSAPRVDAGRNKVLEIKGKEETVQFELIGAIEDDGFGDESVRKPITSRWLKKSGPTEPIFGNVSDLTTEVTFTRMGVYQLELTADNGYASDSDTVKITVNRPPKVEAGPAQTVKKNRWLQLAGKLVDDGLADPRSGTLTYEWTGVSQPGRPPTFKNSQELTAQVKFPEPGEYVLRLTGNNGFGSGSDRVKITVE